MMAELLIRDWSHESDNVVNTRIIMITAMACDIVLIGIYIFTILRMAVRTKLYLNVFTCVLLMLADACFCM